MATTTPDVAGLQAALEGAQTKVTQQADAVRALKAAAKEGNADKVRECGGRAGASIDGCLGI
jgi:hypothetical protein